ncbi:5'-3' exoribonuclease 2-like [Vicia villosa]|uniref:5'-3' exoribonuclease 2-like n=1 Tax=Vicia villosa TaxID=3911 RepID=UPI00273AB012|nr:5'-3' exoribonuclease 2-like [Vicia villosa]
MKLQGTSGVCYDTIAFEKMKRLRLLQLDHVQFIGDYGCFPRNMKWPSWQGFPLKYMPENFYQNNLVAMDLKHNNLTQVWKKPQILKNTNDLKEELKKCMRGKRDLFTSGDFLNDKIKLGTGGFKERYYKEKRSSKFFPAATYFVQKYTDGLLWVLEYYFSGVASWTLYS